MIEFISDYIYFVYFIIIIILFYKLGTIKYNLHLKLGHRGPQPWPFIGNFPQILRYGFYEIDIINRQKYGNIYPFYFGNIATSVIFDEELLKLILIKEAKCFTDRLDIGFNGKISKNMAIVLKGKNWESVRNLISPTFTSGKLRKMSPLIIDCISLLEERINSHPLEEPVDVKELFGAFSIDVIARTMFGIRIDSQTNQNNPFIVHAKNLFKFSIRTPMLLLFLFFPDTMRCIRKFIPNYEIMGRETLEYFVKQLDMAIDERQNSLEEYNDFLTEIMKVKQEQNDKSYGNSICLTRAEIIAQLLMFLMAGYETTASSLSYVAYFLAMNPEAQQEIYEEILKADYNDIGSNGKIGQKMLIILKGKSWERVRNLVSPTFTSGKLRKMSPLMKDCIDLLDKRLAGIPENDPIDVKDVFGTLTMDMIARTMFGMHIDSQTNPNNPFIINAKKLFKFSLFNPMLILILFFPEITPIFRKFFPNWEFLGRQTMNFFVSNLNKAMDERKKSPEQYNDFLTEMMKAHKEVNDSDPEQLEILDSRSLTNSEIIAQSFLFLLAGYETTATSLTYVAYFLAKNPEAQQEVYREIIKVFGTDEEISYEKISNLPFLEAAINESLRICPPASRVDRVCTEDVVLVTSDNKQINAKKGDVFTVPIYAIHMDPEIWPEPYKFDLSRFDNESKKTRSIYSFMPFGMGPRNCVGMRFAVLEMKMALVNLLKQFELVPCAETLDVIKFKKTAFGGPVKPIILKIVKRS